MLTTPRTGLWASRNHAIDTFNLANSAIQDGTLALGNVAAYPTSNLAIYVPIRVKVPGVVVKLALSVGTASGNFDIGLYSAAGVRLVSSGSTAMSGSTTEQVVDVTDTTIGVGRYYVAVNVDNTTATLMRDANTAPWAAAVGILTEALGAVTLPATATWAVNQTLAYIPMMAVLFETTVA